ncbi:MAG: helix-turn-helix domain-containing protein [Firmicutes bacterium]|nr:helix-turn-helix domain-containing protein [Bacillota bacterium]
MLKFGERLFELRNEKNLSTRHLAAELGIHHSAISKWEKGEHEPLISIVIKLAKYFDVSVGYMAGVED